MDFLNKLKERHKSSHQKDIKLQAVNRIRLQDFNNKVYIAFDSTPLIPIEEEWTQQFIIEKLNNLRQTYIDYELYSC